MEALAVSRMFEVKPNVQDFNNIGNYRKESSELRLGTQVK